MKLGKLAILAAAAYYAFKSKLGSVEEQYKSQIELLNQKIDEVTADLFATEDEKQAVIDQYEGDLKDRLYCEFTAKIWKIRKYAGVYWRNWNSVFYLKVKNTGKVAINIRGVRVFWTVEGRTSQRVPWITGSWTIQPGKTIDLKLYGFLEKYHFPNNNDVDTIIDTLRAGGYMENDSDEYKLKLPIQAEADFLVNANGVVKRQTLKNIPGKLIARWNIYTLSADEWSTEGDGTSVSAFDVDEKEDE